MVDVLDGLVHLHATGIVHRDLHLGNILLNRKGNAVLTDFGLSRELALGTSTAYMERTVQMTRHQAPETMVDEGLRQRVSKASDMFAFGCCVFHLVYGEDTYTLHRYMNIAAWRADNKEADPVEAARRVGRTLRVCVTGDSRWADAVQRVMMACFAFDAASRPSAKAAREMLEEASLPYM